MSNVRSADACRLRRAGVCLGTRQDGYSSCAPCREARRLDEAVQRDERRASKRCLVCAARVAKARRYCLLHLAYYAERERKRAAASPRQRCSRLTTLPHRLKEKGPTR